MTAIFNQQVLSNLHLLSTQSHTPCIGILKKIQNPLNKEEHNNPGSI